MSTPTSVRPRTLRTALLIGGSIVIVLVVGYLVFGAIAGANRTDASREIVIDDAFDALKVTAEVTDVVIEYGAVDAPTLTFAQNGDRRDMTFEAQVVGSTLDVSVIDHGRGWWMPLTFTLSPRLRIVLPQGSAPVDLVMNSDVGDVTLSGDFAAVSFVGTAGDLKLDGSATSAEFESTVGDVVSDGYRVSGDLAIESSTGDVELALDSVPRSLSITSNVGDQRVRLPHGSYRVETDTNVGDVRVDVDNQSSSDTLLRFQTTVGNITVTY